MKVLFVPDVPHWAIGHLAKAKVKHLPQFITDIVAVHPRDASAMASEFFKGVEQFKPDVIVYEYFRTAEQLISSQPELKKYKSILVHHNQRDKALYHADWNELGIDVIVAHTKKCKDKLEKKGYRNVHVINHGINFDEFIFNDKEPAEKAIGYVGRIVPWKGLKEVALAGKNLGYPVQVMGKIESPDYFAQVDQSALKFDFFECKDEERIQAYANMTIYVGNSEDNYEEGTLPLLEAMACGVPVVTTPSGIAADILKDGHNALVVPFGDYQALESAIKRLMEDEELRKTLRENAWGTVKNMPEEKMAWEYGKLIQEIAHREELVSVVIPATIDRASQVQEILLALENQTYEPRAIEAVVVWDETVNDENLNRLKLANLTRPSKVSCRQIFTNQEGYNLAMARNLGAIESTGEYLMFCDSRLKPHEDAIQQFVTGFDSVDFGTRHWLFGDKGANKNSFVENFSFMRRVDFFTFGMMPERIDEYGGMSQELRTRWLRQGGELMYLPLARAVQMMGSKMTAKKRKGVVNMKLKLLKMYEGESR